MFEIGVRSRLLSVLSIRILVNVPGALKLSSFGNDSEPSRSISRLESMIFDIGRIPVKLRIFREQRQR